MTPNPDDIDRVRAFNREYTRRIGVLDRSYLGSGLSLTEAGVLHDLQAAGGGATARDLATALGLDEGYVSRMIAKFESAGWLRRTVDRSDGRRRLLALTSEGEARMAPLPAAARAAAGRLIAPLGPSRRAALLAAMDRVAALLGDDAPEAADGLSLRDLQPGDAGWVIQRHGELYARDEGFDSSFEVLVAGIVADFLAHRAEPVERGWIAVDGAGRRLGCIFCVRLDDTTAKLRLFLVEPEARGLGLGRRLLTACLDHARAQGFSRMSLWTHKSHTAACALYAASGFRMVAEKPVENFGQKLVEQSWEIDL